MSFFHKMANAHRRRNNVNKIRINGVWILEENEIKEGCETLENLDAFALEVPFKKNEFVWDFVKDDVMSFFREFYEHGLWMEVFCWVVGEGVQISHFLFVDDTLVVGSLTSTYLGLPLGALFKSVTVWDGVKERFRRRLAMWKRQYISKEGGLL
ncbi:hypothetical protein CK203_046147 [Vitis vinifera]|uniref:Reverse transcriptase zinc-binding domain-containing protein n=1 Tax=Vitis vinifera TaxID=29760 RepID=A0A438I4B2_VITVI|nr:hypothetical protein CK203_046147 [Vitis vinifera]